MTYQTLTGPNDEEDTMIEGDEDTEAFEGDGETTDAEIEAQYDQHLYMSEATLGNAHIVY